MPSSPKIRLVIHPEASSSTSPPKRRKKENKISKESIIASVDINNLLEGQPHAGPLPEKSMMQISQFLGVKELMQLALANKFWQVAIMKILDARLAACQKENGQTDFELVEALSCLCRSAPDSLARRLAVDTIGSCLSDECENVRRQALDTVILLRNRESYAILADLAIVLIDPVVDIRQRAQRFLEAIITSNNIGSVYRLLSKTHLRDAAREIFTAVCQRKLSSTLQTKKNLTVADLTVLVSRENSLDVRISALFLLSDCADPSNADISLLCFQIVHEKDRTVRSAALRTLVHMASQNGRQAYSLVCDLLSNAESQLRKETLVAVNKSDAFRQKDLLRLLKPRIADQDWSVRMLAVQGVNALCSRGSIPGIVACVPACRDTNPGVRFAALNALHKLGDRQIWRSLIFLFRRVAGSERCGWVRTAARNYFSSTLSSMANEGHRFTWDEIEPPPRKTHKNNFHLF